jgi:uncharacterized membrane protein
MPESSEIALFLHILSMLVLVGSIVAVILLLALMRRATDVRDVRQFVRIASVADKFGPAAIVGVVLTGLWMIEDVGFEWDAGWINVSLLTVLVASVASGLVVTRKLAAISAATEEPAAGAPTQVLRVQLTDPVLLGTAHTTLAVVIAIIWNMTTKPGDAQAGTVVLLALVAGAGSAFPMVARRQRILEDRPRSDAS